MSEDVARLAQALGLAIRPEHLQEVERAWRMMEPHRRRVREAELTAKDEPAPVFRPLALSPSAPASSEHD